VTNLNALHNADFVITQSVGSTYVVWALGDAIANVRGALGRELIIAGAAAVNRTVYDADAGQWLVGDAGQLAA
jgi:hypothetical protein